ncbi:hypothetical protein SAMN05421553_2527 [Pseudomonas anguilliseptica]|uniref:Uncharacterized protein n=1 Tax=Pseudomonas anguilliseptica TaxID=53406 RepID=A0A1H5A2A6_PSEAG|nr:hypothetical protein SAMN05421553_2527 [Pseudomonas anguilliseptica]
MLKFVEITALIPDIREFPPAHAHTVEHTRVIKQAFNTIKRKEARHKPHYPITGYIVGVVRVCKKQRLLFLILSIDYWRFKMNLYQPLIWGVAHY